MNLDARTVEVGTVKQYDLCIIGGGPAGLTIANELKDLGCTICVLESGGFTRSSHTDRLRKLESEGIAIKEDSRARIFGGASTVWSGLSSLLDEIEFEERPYVTVPGWPIPYATLAEYYARASEHYGFPDLGRLHISSRSSLRAKGALQPVWSYIDEKIFLASDPVRNFGNDFRDLFDHIGCDLISGATVVELKSFAADAGVGHALVRSSEASIFRVSAKLFVVAAGGIENARLLLLSKDLHPTGLGNTHDQVGRYFMNHPKNYCGVITLTKPIAELPYFFGHAREGYAGYAGLRLNESAQRKRRLLNSYVRFEPLYPWSDSRGVGALIALVKSIKSLMRFWRRSNAGEMMPLRDYAETGDTTESSAPSIGGILKSGLLIMRDFIPVSRYVFARLFTRGAPKVKKIRLRNFMEMEPRAENRVTLSGWCDAYGVPLPKVAHECSELDKRSLIELHTVLAQEVAAAGLGILQGSPQLESVWPINRDASHHMGTTRMGHDAATSVVDSNCKIHGVENVYIAGASVFAMSGCANPTMTLVALAIRLADHLKTKIVAQTIMKGVRTREEATEEHSVGA